MWRQKEKGKGKFGGPGVKTNTLRVCSSEYSPYPTLPGMYDERTPTPYRCLYQTRYEKKGTSDELPVYRTYLDV